MSGASPFTLTVSGTDAGTKQEAGDVVTGEYSRGEAGTDLYVLTESGTLPGGGFTETVTGTDTYAATETGNEAKGTHERTTTGGGSYVRTVAGPGATLGNATGANAYTLGEEGNARVGRFSQAKTGTDRYGLVEAFVDVSNAEGGATPGHVTFYSHGLPFRDPQVQTNILVEENQKGFWIARLSAATGKTVSAIPYLPGSNLYRIVMDSDDWSQANHDKIAGVLGLSNDGPLQQGMGKLFLGNVDVTKIQAADSANDAVLMFNPTTGGSSLVPVITVPADDPSWFKRAARFATKGSPLQWIFPDTTRRFSDGVVDELEETAGAMFSFEGLIRGIGVPGMSMTGMIIDIAKGNVGLHTVSPLGAKVLQLGRELVDDPAHAAGRLVAIGGQMFLLKRVGDKLSVTPKGKITSPKVDPPAVAQAEAKAAANAPKLTDANRAGCFVAGTLLLTPSGFKPIEEFAVGDSILSRSESDVNAWPEAKEVEEIFIRSALTLRLTVSGRIIETTQEHPFYVLNKGWRTAGLLEWGDVLASHNATLGVVEKVTSTGEVKIVYNMRVADWHTYFVGCDEWGFSVWAHNSCYVPVRENGQFVIYEVKDGLATKYAVPAGHPQSFTSIEAANAYITKIPRPVSSNVPMDFLVEGLRQQGLKRVPNAGEFKMSWVEDGFRYEARVHPGTQGGKPVIYRISRQKLELDPVTGQGSGTQYLDSKGVWHKESTLKDKSPNYNSTAAADTHIPLPNGMIQSSW